MCVFPSERNFRIIQKHLPEKRRCISLSGYIPGDSRMKTEGYYVNTGRWQSVNGKKIKIVVFGMVVALLVTFLPFRQTEIYAGISENAYSYYQEYGNNVCFSRSRKPMG